MKNLVVKTEAGMTIIDIESIVGVEILDNPPNPQQPSTIVINVGTLGYMFLKNRSVSESIFDKLRTWLMEGYKTPTTDDVVIDE